MKIRKITAIFLCAALLCPVCIAVQPDNSAGAIILMSDDGTVLFEKNADARMQIASITKVMTALLVLERCELDEQVRIKSEYTNIEGSSMYLEEDEVLSVEQLLYGLLLASGNDAAAALACYTAGSIEKFAELMNEKTAELGLENTSFKNPHGLNEEGHYSSARDMALITAKAIENEDFVRIVSTKTATVAGRSLSNHNKLLWNCEGTLGVKTGYTSSAGRTLISCAERNGLRLICVTLNDPDDWKDHSAAYEWAFENFRKYTVARAQRKLCTVAVVSGTSDRVGICPAKDCEVMADSDDKIEIKLYLRRFVYAGVKGGEKAGSMSVLVNGKETERVDLLFAEDVELDEAVRLTAWEKLKKAWYMANEYSGYYSGLEPCY